MVVNPGSVGLPAYIDDIPHPHTMQAGSPHARYSVLSATEKGWQVKNVALDYDWRPAVAAARCNGRQDWAHWLRTGLTI